MKVVIITQVFFYLYYLSKPIYLVYAFLASSRNSAAYEQGLAEMADLMTTVDLSEAEKRKIRERFALK